MSFPGFNKMKHGQKTQTEIQTAVVMLIKRSGEKRVKEEMNK